LPDPRPESLGLFSTAKDRNISNFAVLLGNFRTACDVTLVLVAEQQQKWRRQ